MEQDRASTLSQLEKSVAAILVYRHTDALSKDYDEILQKLTSKRVRLFAVCNLDPNYQDEVSKEPEQLDALMKEGDERLNGCGAECLRIDVYSAFKGRKFQDEYLIEASGIRNLEERLREYLISRGIDSLRERITEVLVLINEVAIQTRKDFDALSKKVVPIKQRIEQIQSEAKVLFGSMHDVKSSLQARDLAENYPVTNGVFGGLAGGSAGAMGAVALAVAATPVAAVAALVVGTGGFMIGRARRKRRYTSVNEHWERFQGLLKSSSIIVQDTRSKVQKDAVTGKSQEVIQILEVVKGDIDQRVSETIKELKNTPVYREYSAISGLQKEMNRFQKAFTQISVDVKDLLERIRSIKK